MHQEPHYEPTWPYIKITPELLAEVGRLRGLGLDTANGCALIAEHFHEKLAGTVFARELDDELP